MAVVRARTSPPYALIIFVFLTVIFAGLTVWLLTQQGDLKKRISEADEKLPKYVAPSETKDAEAVLALSPGGGAKPSVFSALKRQRDKLVTAINGTQTPDAKGAAVADADASQAMRDAVDALQHTAVRAPATTTINSLTDAVKNLRQALATSDSEIRRLSAQLKQTEDDLTANRLAAQKQVDELNAGAGQQATLIAKLEKDIAAARAREPEIAGAHQQELTKQSEANEAKVRDLQLIIAQLKQDQKAAYEKIKVLQNELSLGRGGVSPGIPDNPSGKIIRTNLTEGEVHINLGRADHVKRGLSFVVFDARSGVKTDPGQDQGKGAIEVVEVGENSSRCRITNTVRGFRIAENDVIYNLVFSQQKGRKFRFAVYGEFDLDGDGNATSGERARIARMIEDWGGVVVDIPMEELRDANGQPILDKDGKPLKGPQIRPQTDFLIIGEQPADPRDAKNLDLVSGEQIDELRSKLNEYKFVENQAKFSTVTKLNANRFLHLIGYYNTTLVKH